MYADGDKYEGEWKDDKVCDENGFSLLPTKRSIGSVSYDHSQRHGKGTVTYRGEDGNVLEKYEVSRTFDDGERIRPGF